MLTFWLTLLLSSCAGVLWAEPLGEALDNDVDALALVEGDCAADEAIAKGVLRHSLARLERVAGFVREGAVVRSSLDALRGGRAYPGKSMTGGDGRESVVMISVRFEGLYCNRLVSWMIYFILVVIALLSQICMVNLCYSLHLQSAT